MGIFGNVFILFGGDNDRGRLWECVRVSQHLFYLYFYTGVERGFLVHCLFVCLVLAVVGQIFLRERVPFGGILLMN
jgi:hypothetical protein